MPPVGEAAAAEPPPLHAAFVSTRSRRPASVQISPSRRPSPLCHDPCSQRSPPASLSSTADHHGRCSKSPWPTPKIHHPCRPHLLSEIHHGRQPNQPSRPQNSPLPPLPVLVIPSSSLAVRWLPPVAPPPAIPSSSLAFTGTHHHNRPPISPSTASSSEPSSDLMPNPSPLLLLAKLPPCRLPSCCPRPPDASPSSPAHPSPQPLSHGRRRQLVAHHQRCLLLLAEQRSPQPLARCPTLPASIHQAIAAGPPSSSSSPASSSIPTASYAATHPPRLAAFFPHGCHLHGKPELPIVSPPPQAPTHRLPFLISFPPSQQPHATAPPHHLHLWLTPFLLCSLF